MSRTVEQLPLTVAELRAYSPAARRVLQMRRTAGNNTPYDRFLCDYIGDPAPGSPHFRSIARTALSGATLFYNNPLNMHRSFSTDGTLLNVRWAQGEIAPGDHLKSAFVATADLRTGITTEWTVTDIERPGYNNARILTLEPPADLRLVVDGEPGYQEDPLAASLAECQTRARARLVLDVYGTHFTPIVGPTEELHEIHLLVNEVNTLTWRDGIEDLEARRAAASEHLAPVIPLLLRAA
jgi:hypothetical protein